MKGLWLHRAPHNAAAPLIVFCNGWGMTEQVVAHLDGAGCNVLCLYDYRSPELPAGLRGELCALMQDGAKKISSTVQNNATTPAASAAGVMDNTDSRSSMAEDTSLPRTPAASNNAAHETAGNNADNALKETCAATRATPQRILIAWSLGVFMSACVRRQLPPFDVTLACNGTQRPIDAACGIPSASYEATERMLCPASRDAFMANAGMDSGLCRQDVEELREELAAVRRLAISGTVDTPPFDAAIISRKDRIFSARNQRRWWQSRPETRIIPQEGGHCPFANFSAWLELVHV